MSARRRWEFLSYGPGVLLGAVGVLGFAVAGQVWGLAILFAGIASIAQAVSARHLYRSAYFRGRGDQLRDLSTGSWPDPTKMDPQPWDAL